MKNVIICDLDGTLFDASHRVHLAQAAQWEQYHELAHEDKVFADIVRLLEWLRYPLGNEIIACTGRPERYRKVTIEGFIKHNVDYLFDDLLMRPENDWGSDGDVKVRLVDEHFGGREAALEKVFCVLDDRDKVVEAFRNAGYRCLQVAQGTY